MQKFPPVEKIYEAYSAIVDGRVRLFEDYALVQSSDKKKEYTVTWKDSTYAANDNATYWQGYSGYPILAVLMLQGKLPLDKVTASRFAGVNWTALNRAAKGDYAKAADTLFKNRAFTPVEEAQARKAAEEAHLALQNAGITAKRGRKRTPAKE